MLKKQYSFRDYHLLEILSNYDKQKLPLDLTLHHYFKAHKALGSKDRGLISETIYKLVRWKGLLDHFSSEDPSWERRLRLLTHIDFNAITKDPSLPPHIAFSFPEVLYQLIKDSYGEEKAKEIALICNEQAPTTIRVNTLKTSRDILLDKWRGKFDISPCKVSQTGIVFNKKIALFSLPEFKEGLFEVQDEGSQLLSECLQVLPGDLVLDFCSGSGGKTLAFAPKMENKGQIYLHDIRPHILIEAKRRLKRAGIQNAQIITQDSTLLKLKKKMDWVLVDAPCSGTGTIRRNPDMKWNFTKEMLDRLQGQQRTIFEKALSFLKPDGKIVYATCSILKEENEDQVDHFMKAYSLEIVGSPFKILPTKNGMDGFFAVTFKRIA